jgi:hypothetical protein
MSRAVLCYVSLLQMMQLQISLVLNRDKTFGTLDTSHAKTGHVEKRLSQRMNTPGQLKE